MALKLKEQNYYYDSKPNAIKRIHETINNAFNNKRIVFWYD